MRFKKKNIIFDDDITEGCDYTEICGYLWATDDLCDLAEIFNKFVEYYWDTKENFNDFVEEWKEENL